VPLKVVIPGANGFIGSARTEAILKGRDWEMYGMDLANHKLRSHSRLDYTLIHPFNFIGPNLDNIEEPKEGRSRVFTQFLSSVMHLGWTPTTDLDSAIRKTIAYYVAWGISALSTLSASPGRGS
jgi:nucleoside-diphosphate-sugar epimerase